MGESAGHGRKLWTFARVCLACGSRGGRFFPSPVSSSCLLAGITGIPAPLWAFVSSHHHILLPNRPLPVCQPDKTAHHILAHVEQVLYPALPVRILCRVNGHGNHDLPGAAHHKLQKPVLHRRKPGVAVQGHHAVFYQLRIGDHPAQYVQDLLRRDVPV